MAAATGCGLLAVLQQLLQHSDLLDEQRTVCALLGTSKTVSVVVRDHSLGRLSVTFSFHSLQRVQQFAKWLKANAKLLRSLGIHLAVARSISVPNTHEATDLIAGALQHAAEAHPAGLLLEQVKLQELHCTPQLLQQLQHSTQLTRLELQLCQRFSNGGTSNNSQMQQAERYRPLVSALAGLTSLQRLQLHSHTIRNQANDAEVLAPALSALSQLTALQIDVVHYAAVLQYIPQQLQQLHLLPSQRILGEVNCEPLQLNRLTALTALSTSCKTWYSKSEPRPYACMVVRQADQLPANLQVMVVKDVRSAEPFEQLKGLRKLVLCECSMRAADISILASYCRQLQDVQLWYPAAADLEAVAAAWKQLPLTELHTSSSQLSADVLQHIACLHSTLQCLDIRGGAVTATATETAAALAWLTQLHTLQLRLTHEAAWNVFSAVAPAAQHGQQQAQDDVAAADTGFAVTHAIASLPQLTYLMIGCAEPHVVHHGNSLGCALVPLGAATQITT